MLRHSFAIRLAFAHFKDRFLPFLAVPGDAVEIPIRFPHKALLNLSSLLSRHVFVPFVNLFCSAFLMASVMAAARGQGLEVGVR